MTTNGNITVTKIEAENFLLISKMDYIPRPGVNVFVGKNREGKTDILRLLKAILKGAGIEIISHGKDKSSFMARLSDGHEIRRVITEKSKRFQVKTIDGDIKASPQAYLDFLLGDSDLSFDPISFVLKNPKEQKQMFLETFNIGKIEPELLSNILEQEIIDRLDFKSPALEVLKDAENIIYTKRSEINKEVAKSKTFYEDTLAKVKDFKEEDYQDSEVIQTNIDDKERELAEAKAIIKQVEGSKALRDRLNGTILTAEKELEGIDDKLIDNLPIYERSLDEIDKEIQELMRKRDEIREVIKTALDFKIHKNELVKSIEGDRTTIKQLPSTENIPNVSVIGKQLSELKNDLELSKTFKEAMDFKVDYEMQKARSDKLTAIIEILRKDLPEQIMQDTNIPFKSLTFDGDEVVIDGNRLSLMATSDQLFTTLQIYKERNKNAKLKIICADRIECLDDESYKKFWEFINVEGFQVFATKVISAQIPEDAVWIEGGALKEGVKV